MINLLISPDFFSAVSKLAPSDQARANNFVQSFNKNPDSPGINLEKLHGAKGQAFFSGRISQELRAILHQDGEAWVLLHADHHDAAYTWAERRQVNRHKVTGALQLVELQVVQQVQQAMAQESVQAPDMSEPLFAEHADDYLLSLGLPEDWLPTLRLVRDDDQLLQVCENLPQDVAERLLDLAAGEFVTPPAVVPPEQPVVASPDTRRRFYVVEQDDDLLAALQAPMERWISFLHPSQRAIVQRTFNGPVKVTGSAGTGKTVVAMHRARHLARQGKRVLLTSYVSTLCDNLKRNLRLLCSEEELSYITVSTVHSQALKLAQVENKGLCPADDGVLGAMLDSVAAVRAPGSDVAFLKAEWDAVIQAQGILSWPEYRKAPRTGRGQPLSAKERKALWQVFDGVMERLAEKNQASFPDLCRRAEQLLLDGKATSPFDAVIVDEVQDLKSPALRFLRALCQDHPEYMMVVGDAGQRIYPGGFSLSSLGIEVRGRSHILRINYRTTEQIRQAADRILGLKADDLDGGTESRKGTHSLLRGPHPTLQGFNTREQEDAAAVEQIKKWLASGLRPEAISVFARVGKRLNSLGSVMEAADIPSIRLRDDKEESQPAVRMGTMHRAKGLEFKAVLVLDCSAAVLPHPKVLKAAADPADRQEAEERERRLLYVAMTRARDELALTWSGKPSSLATGIGGA